MLARRRAAVSLGGARSRSGAETRASKGVRCRQRLSAHPGAATRSPRRIPDKRRQPSTRIAAATMGKASSGNCHQQARPVRHPPNNGKDMRMPVRDSCGAGPEHAGTESTMKNRQFASSRSPHITRKPAGPDCEAMRCERPYFRVQHPPYDPQRARSTLSVDRRSRSCSTR